VSFKDPFGQLLEADLNLSQPKKELMQLLTFDNIAQSNHVLENEEKKRTIILEEQILLRKKLENLAKMKLQTEDKSTEGGGTVQTSAPALDLKKEDKAENDELDDGEPLDFIIDRTTGKKMSRKRINIMYQSGAFN
jgi:hypothetical protein